MTAGLRSWCGLGSFRLKPGRKGAKPGWIRQYPQTVLIHRQAETAADLLPLLHGAPGLIEGADLEDIGVVPTFAQGRMTEDEAQRLVEGE